MKKIITCHLDNNMLIPFAVFSIPKRATICDCWHCFAESGHNPSQPISKSSSSVSLYSAGSEGTAIFGQSNRASASSSNTDLTSLPTNLQADGLENFNPFFPTSLLQWVWNCEYCWLKAHTAVWVNSHVVTYYFRPVSFGSSSFFEVQGLGELGCTWEVERILPALS